MERVVWLLNLKIKAATAMSTRTKTRTKVPQAPLPEVNFSDDGTTRYLHLGSPWVQGSMRLDKPYALDLEYIQRMMAWLLFFDPARLSSLRAMQLGLGAASLTKFCRKKLLMNTTAIEINPQVVLACRTWFKLPADDAKLQVVLADAIQEITRDHWQRTVDALMVDLYDDDAKAPVANDAPFYENCRALLTDDGVMTVNLFGRSSHFEETLTVLREVFGEACVWCLKPTREGNTIVIATRTPRALTNEQLADVAQAVANHSGLPAKKWLKVIQRPNFP
jgi:spermidine synthase